MSIFISFVIPDDDRAHTRKGRGAAKRARESSRGQLLNTRWNKCLPRNASLRLPRRANQEKNKSVRMQFSVSQWLAPSLNPCQLFSLLGTTTHSWSWLTAASWLWLNPNFRLPNDDTGALERSRQQSNRAKRCSSFAYERSKTARDLDMFTTVSLVLCFTVQLVVGFIILFHDIHSVCSCCCIWIVHCVCEGVCV